MTADEILKSALALAEATKAGDWQTLPEGNVMTLHLASDGVRLELSKVVAVRVIGEQGQARSAKGDQYVFAVSDIFACAVDAGEARGRKAGFSP